MQQYRSIEVNIQAYPSLARKSDDGEWERYRYGLQEWASDFHVQGEVMTTGDWEQCEPGDTELHIRAYDTDQLQKR